jgi:DNA-binding PadR family transcriptional regulator
MKSLPRPLIRLQQSLQVGNLWLSVLSIASKNRVYAYTLPKEIKRRFNFSPSLLLVYLVLYRLESEGLLRSYDDGRRRYYCITKKGKKCLEGGILLLKKRASEL